MARVPFGVVGCGQVEEAEVGFFFAKGVRIVAESRLGGSGTTGEWRSGRLSIGTLRGNPGYRQGHDLTDHRASLRLDQGILLGAAMLPEWRCVFEVFRGAFRASR